MPEKRTMMKRLSDMQFSFEIPNIYGQNCPINIIFTTEESETKVLKSDSIYGELSVPISNLHFNCKATSVEDSELQAEKLKWEKNRNKTLTDIIEKLRLVKTFLNPIVNEIVEKASQLSETEIFSLQYNNYPLCKMSLSTFSGAVKASKLLQEVNSELYETTKKQIERASEFLSFPQTNYIVNTLYYPNGNIENEPLDFDKYIYIDKGLMKQLIELQRVLANIVAKLGLSEIEKRNPNPNDGKKTEDTEDNVHQRPIENHWINKEPLDDDVQVNTLHHSLVTNTDTSHHSSVLNNTPLHHSLKTFPKNSTNSSNINDTEEVKHSVLKCLLELSEIRKFLEERHANEDLDISNEIQLSGAPQFKECCLKHNIPHLHAKLNGIPVVLKINRETMKSILSNVNVKTKKHSAMKCPWPCKKKTHTEPVLKKDSNKEQYTSHERMENKTKQSKSTYPEKCVCICNQLTGTEDFLKEAGVSNMPEITKTKFKTQPVDITESSLNPNSYNAQITNANFNEILENSIKNATSSINTLNIATNQHNNEYTSKRLPQNENNSSVKTNMLNNMVRSKDTSKNSILQQLLLNDSQAESTDVSKSLLPQEIKTINTLAESVNVSKNSVEEEILEISPARSAKVSKNPLPQTKSTSMFNKTSIQNETHGNSSAQSTNKSKNSLAQKLNENSSVRNINISKHTLQNEIEEIPSVKVNLSRHSVQTKPNKNAPSRNIHISENFEQKDSNDENIVLSRSAITSSTESLQKGINKNVPEHFISKQKSNILFNKNARENNPSRKLSMCARGKGPMVKPKAIRRIDELSDCNHSSNAFKKYSKENNVHLFHTNTIQHESSNQIKAFDRNLEQISQVRDYLKANKQFSINRKTSNQYNFDVPPELVGESSRKMLYDISSNFSKSTNKLPMNLTMKDNIKTFLTTMKLLEHSQDMSNANSISLFNHQYTIVNKTKCASKIFADKGISTHTEELNPSNNCLLPQFELKNEVLPSIDTDTELIISNIRAHVLRPHIVNELKRIGIDNIRETYSPAACCRKSILNESPQVDLPYPASLMSLPLNEMDVDEIGHNVKKYFSYDKLKYYTNLGKDDFPWTIPTYEVRYFEITHTQKKPTTAENKHKPTKVLYDKSWKFQLYNIKMYKDNMLKKIELPAACPHDFMSIKHSKKKFKNDGPPVNIAKQYSTSIESPYSPSTHSLPGVGLIAVPGMYKASQCSLPQNTTQVHMVLSSNNKDNSKDDETSLSPEQYANFEKNGLKQNNSTKSIQTSSVHVRPKQIICSSNNASGVICKNPSCNKIKQTSRNKKALLVDASKKCKVSCKRSYLSNSGEQLHPRRSRHCTNASNKDTLSLSVSSKSSNSRSHTSFGKPKCKPAHSPSHSSPSKSTTVLFTPKQTTSKHYYSKSTTKLPERRKTKSKSKLYNCSNNIYSIVAGGKKNNKDMQTIENDENIHLVKSGKLKKPISKGTEKAIAESNLSPNKIFWALTKIHIYEDGSQKLDILDISSRPPGRYMVSEVNKVVLMGQNPSKTD